MGTWVEETNRLILVKVAQATFQNEGRASNLQEWDLDSRSEQRKRFPCGIEDTIFTVKSLILAQDER